MFFDVRSLKGFSNIWGCIRLQRLRYEIINFLFFRYKQYIDVLLNYIARIINEKENFLENFLSPFKACQASTFSSVFLSQRGNSIYYNI